MSIPFHTETFHFGPTAIHLCIPDGAFIEQRYNEIKQNKIAVEFPYWAKLWPASIALCEFIAAKPEYVENKKVLELAAGLGLPSLLAASLASNVIASDYLPEAINFIHQSATVNRLKNIQCQLIDWNAIDESINADVILLSDINYAPSAFDQLYNVIQSFLINGSTIILSTPQRLTAKIFLERLESWSIEQKEIVVQLNNEEIYTSVWVLKHPSKISAAYN